MTKKTIKITALILACFFCLCGCEEFFRRRIGGFAGSYPYVESWDFKATEAEVIDAVKELKRENSNLQPPNQTEIVSKRDTGYIWESTDMKIYKEKLKKDPLTPLPEKTYDNYYHDYWLFIDFYYTDTEEIVHTWTRPDLDAKVTTFAFVGLNDKLINRDYWFIANRKEIHKFKKTIVDKIQKIIDRKRKASS